MQQVEGDLKKPSQLEAAKWKTQTGSQAGQDPVYVPKTFKKVAVFAHGAGNLVVAAAEVLGKCQLHHAKSSWFELQVRLRLCLFACLFVCCCC